MALSFDDMRAQLRDLQSLVTEGLMTQEQFEDARLRVLEKHGLVTSTARGSAEIPPGLHPLPFSYLFTLFIISCAYAIKSGGQNIYYSSIY